MENQPFFLRLYKNKFALVLIVIVFVLSAYALYYVSSQFTPVYYIEATKLDEKPEFYFPLSNPQSYGIQTIFDEGTGVEIDGKVFSDISKMQTTHGTKNVEYSDNYYELQLIVGDRFPPANLLRLSFTFLLVSGALIMGVLLVKVKMAYDKKRLTRVD